MTKENKLASQKSIMARWRDGGIGCSRLPWLTLRRMVFVLASAVAAWVHVAEASIPLMVKCRCERADANRDIRGKTETLWGFVSEHNCGIRVRAVNFYCGVVFRARKGL